MDPLALGGQTVAQAGLDLLQQAVDVAPVGGGLQGVHGVARLPRGLAQVGKRKRFCAHLRPSRVPVKTPPKRFSKAFAWLSDNPFCRRLPVTPKVSMHLPSPAPRSARYFSSQAICPGWPARASWVMVSTALDRRSIDSGTRAWASSRVACRACCQFGRKTL